MCASVLLGGAMAQSGVAPPNSGFSTHDRSDFELAALPHTCNDVKTPGDGRTYSVFTIGVRKTEPPSSDPLANLWFSGALGYRGGWDAIRVMHHMLPDGVGRTDGTGWYSGGFPLPGLSGGTTPQCALSPGGSRIGQPAPQAQRMFVDVEGQVAAGNLISILCDRPPSTGVLEFAGLQFGFPGLQPPIVLATGLEIYITSNPIVLLALVVPGQSIRFPIGNSGPGTATPLPPGPMTFSVQFLFTLSTPVPGGVVGSCGLASQELASPALWVSY